MVQTSTRLHINLNRKTKLPIENIVYVWAINVGRLLILVTEIIALGALFYRFVVDQQVMNQQDQINTYRGMVLAEAGQEARYRSIQERLNIVKNVQAATNLKLTLMNDILQASNNGTFISPQISINNNLLTVNAITPQVALLNQFVESMKQNPSIVSINIDNISSANQGIAFQLTIGIKDITSK